jgi:hypothetical protein
MSGSGGKITPAVVGAVAIVAGLAALVWVVGLPTARPPAPAPLAPAGTKPATDLARPIDLYELTVEEAWRLAGKRVEVFLEVGCPVDVGDGYTDVAAYERPDGVERHVYLVGEHHDIGAGDRLTAVGVLRVVEHAEVVVNGVTVPGWTEIRVEQARGKVTASDGGGPGEEPPAVPPGKKKDKGSRGLKGAIDRE